MLMGNLQPILKSYIIRAIRQAFVRSDQYLECKKRNRREYIKYKLNGEVSKQKSVMYNCEICNKEFKDKEMQVDHKSQVVQLYESANDLTISTYISRVYCSALNLQLVCKSCHNIKTTTENKTRKQLKINKFPKKKRPKLKL